MLIAEIRNGVPEYVDRPDVDTRTLQALVGGRLDTAFLLPNPCGFGDIIGYVSADAVGLRPNCRVGETVVHGTLVIVGVGTDGTHRSLEHTELDALTLARGTEPDIPELQLAIADPDAC